jgi:large subunit ribosomal protein L6
MSRIGKLPIPIPKSVKIEVEGDLVTVASADGKKKISQKVDLVAVSVEKDNVVVKATEATRAGRSRHGLYRTLIANMIAGVTQGWSKTLEISGAGFKVEKQTNKLVLTVGYTHPKTFPIPAGIEVETPSPTIIVVKGIDKGLVGQVAASLRAIHRPDPYKGKGIRYQGEKAIRKVAKGKGK